VTHPIVQHFCSDFDSCRVMFCLDVLLKSSLKCMRTSGLGIAFFPVCSKWAYMMHKPNVCAYILNYKQTGECCQAVVLGCISRCSLSFSFRAAVLQFFIDCLYTICTSECKVPVYTVIYHVTYKVMTMIRFVYTETHREVDRLTDRQTGRQAGRRAGGRAGRQADR